MTDLTLFHTSAIHQATFDRLAPDAALAHVLRDDWLARAQGGLDAALRSEIRDEIAAIDGPVLCSCTTIGEAAATGGAIRIDAPMMEEAARIGGPVLMVCCLDSTVGPSGALLKQAFGDADPMMQTLVLPQHWPLFEAGETDRFASAIATDTLAALDASEARCVVLAQLSMAPAAEKVQAMTDVPVLSSPELAVAAVLPGV